MGNETRHRAKKSLGQNFLQDRNICMKIVDALDIQHHDHVIEIGPGQGALTGDIIEAQPTSITALEMDDSLAEKLETQYENLQVVRGDALKFQWQTLDTVPHCKIIGNLPYNVGSKLIWDIVSSVKSLEKAVFMVQHEVALRLTATPGNKAYGGLTAWVNNFASTKYLFKVPPTVFRPQPKVDSAVIAFVPHAADDWPQSPEKLSRLIKMLFQKRRKQISTILKGYWTSEIETWFKDNNLKPSLRPENLTPSQMRALSELL